MDLTDFDSSNWAERDFAHRYLNEADVRIIERRRMLEILKSHYIHFLREKRRNKVLDLGCGDGILTYELLQIDDSISATLIDASEDMLKKAKDRLSHIDSVIFIKSSFQELMNTDIQLPNFNLIISSLAIHHLDNNEKKRLFEYIYNHLEYEGYFVNIDVVLSPTLSIEEWYRELWREWMVEKCADLNLGADFDCESIVNIHAEEEHFSKIDTLNDQLDMLVDVEFKDVDCFYKYGLFAMYGGKKY